MHHILMKDTSSLKFVKTSFTSEISRNTAIIPAAIEPALHLFQ